MHIETIRIPVLLTLLFFLSCTIVKEDRNLCPCNLSVGLDAPGDVRLIVEGRSFIMEAVLPGDTTVVWRVPRPDVRITAVSGAGWDGGVRIPPGEQCPPLYLGVGRVKTDSEEAHCSAPLHKSYCELSMNFVCPSGWKPMPVRVSGNVCGYGPGGGPLQGEFSYSTAPSAQGHCSVRLPRQMDSSLLLSMGGGWTFALGEYILQSGYDWAAPDLKDVSLDINISLTSILFRIGTWTRTEQLWFLV